MQTPDTSPFEAEVRFPSLAAMRSVHRVLLRAAKEKHPGLRGRILRFLEQGRQTGTLLDTLDERGSAQSLLDYWTATLYSLPPAGGVESEAGSVPDAVLAEFDVQALQSVAHAAEQCMASLGPQDQEVARRVLLQLVRLAPEGGRFEAEPTSQEALESLGNAGQVRSILERLREAQVVRVNPGETTERPQFELRYAALTREWKRLGGWLEQRVRFREAALRWERDGRSPIALARGSWLGDALGYHDLSGVERDFILNSQKGEVRRTWALRGWATAFFVLAVTAIIGWIQAEQQREAAVVARMEAEISEKLVRAREEEAKTALQERERSLALLEEANEWRQVLLSKVSLRETTLKVIADSGAPPGEHSRELEALQEWAYTWPEQWTVPYDPGFTGSSPSIPLPGMSPELQRQTYKAGQVLDYYHYSLVLHEERAMALYTASNYDRSPSQQVRVPRAAIKAWFDSRVPRELQLGGEVYERNNFDRGHLVARGELLWGPVPQPPAGTSISVFDLASSVYTNFTPQYDAFNQGVWKQIEQYIQAKHNPDAPRLSIFTGPVFRDDDYSYRGVRVPRTFWKIAVSRSTWAPNRLVVDAFMADQYDPRTPTLPLNHGPTQKGCGFDLTRCRTSVQEIEHLTGLDFGVLRTGHPSIRESASSPP